VAESVLSIRDADAYYGRVQALRAVSLDVRRVEVVTLLGANGAGKSTLLRMISGIVRPARGVVMLNGSPITNSATHRIVKAGVGHVPEGRQLFPELTVADNLHLGAYRATLDPKRLDSVLDLFPLLRARFVQLAGTLSGGEQQMLAIARALMGNPSLLLLDEPSMGLSPVMVELVGATIRKLKEDGLTILLVEQNAALALGVADRAYVIELGRIVASGDTNEIRTNPALIRAYLGEKRSTVPPSHGGVPPGQRNDSAKPVF
jgi:branched-chain amino acid transport system ATP-binding protein